MADHEHIMSKDETSWRLYIADRLRSHEERILELAEQHKLFQAQMDKNTTATEGVEKNTKDMLEVFNSWKGAMNVLEWLGKVSKWLAAIGAAGTMIYVLLKTGQMPHGK